MRQTACDEKASNSAAMAGAPYGNVEHQRWFKHVLTGTTFSFYSDQEIKKLSVKEVTNPTAFNTLGAPLRG